MCASEAKGSQRRMRTSEAQEMLVTEVATMMLEFASSRSAPRAA